MPSILTKVSIGTQRHRVVGCIAWLDDRRDNVLSFLPLNPIQRHGILIRRLWWRPIFGNDAALNSKFNGDVTE